MEKTEVNPLVGGLPREGAETCAVIEATVVYLCKLPATCETLSPQLWQVYFTAPAKSQVEKLASITLQLI